MKKQKSEDLSNVSNVTKTPRIVLTKKMKSFLKVFENQAGRITISCEKAGINRRTYYRWLDNLKFADEIERINEKFKDFVEGKIIQALREGDKNLLKFYAKTKLRDRGYVERQEVEITRESSIFTPEEREAEIKRLLKK